MLDTHMIEQINTLPFEKLSRKARSWLETDRFIYRCPECGRQWVRPRTAAGRPDLVRCLVDHAKCVLEMCKRPRKIKEEEG